MNEKHLLINSVTLLFRASQLPSNSNDFAGLVREIIADIKLPEFNSGIGGENKVIGSLKQTVLSMCSETDPQLYGLNELLQRVRIDVGDESDLYEALTYGVSSELTEEEIKKLCLNISDSLRKYIREKRVNEILSKASYQLKFERDKIGDISRFLSELSSQLEPYQGSLDVEQDPAIVSSANFDRLEEVRSIFEEVKVMNLSDGIMVCGYQGINRMTRGGFRRGEQIVIGALQHNYKTGFSLSLFRQLAMYNKPFMLNPKKKPLLIRISFEDNLSLNMEFLYNTLKENETGFVPNTEGVSEEEMATYVRTRLSETGYHIQMLRVDPTKWTYRDIINYCLRQEAEGYEIHVLMVDYLKMLPTTGCTQGAMGQDVRDMFRRVRNFTSPRRITFITPHQLSTEAKMMIREGRSDFVRELPGKGYYDGCKTIDNEVDMELFIHIEKVNGKAYLTVQRGKHRINGVTPPEHLYCILPFKPNGSILDDINGPDTTCSRLGGGPIGSKEEVPFFDFA